MSKYAFIVSACSKYIPELTALLNSLELMGNVHDVHINGFNLPPEFVGQFGKLSYNVWLHAISEEQAREYGGESEILCRKRYYYASEWGANYEAVCILDADMIVVRNMDNFFKIAEAGIILGVTLEQKTTYGTDEDGHDHQRVLGEHIVKKRTWNDKDICCTPMFINPNTYADQLEYAWQIFTLGYPDNNFKAPDQQAFNMILVADDLAKNVVLLPNMCWVGSNEKLLKPYTRVTVQQDGLLWTESGEPIFIFHGRYYTKKWRQQQILNRHGCAAGYLKATECCDAIAEGAMNCLYEFFKKCLSGPIQIDTMKEYTTDGLPDKTYAELGRPIV
jgi:hypothetical protein